MYIQPINFSYSNSVNASKQNIVHKGESNKAYDLVAGQAASSF